MASLDVGCGRKPRGDVNSDIRVSAEWKRYKDKIFICCDAHYLPIRNNCLGLAFCVSVLPYVHNEAQVVRELSRVLKIDGKAVIEHNLLSIYLKDLFKNTRQPLNIVRRIYLYFFRHNVQNPIINTFQTRRGIVNLLRTNNFSITEVRKINNVLHVEARRRS